MSDSTLDGLEEPGAELEAAFRALAPNPGGAEAEPPPFDALAGRLDRETGVVSWLRSRSTPLRIAILLGCVLGSAFVVSLVSARPDVAVYPSLRLTLELALLAGFGLIALAGSLRGHQHPEIPRKVGWCLVGGAIVIPLVLALLPMADEVHPLGLEGTGDALVPMALGCLGYGLAIAAPVLLVAWVLDRGEHRGRPRVRLAAAGAGLAGLIGLELHCPVQAHEHLMIGHAPLVLLMLGAAALLSLARRT